MLIRATLVTALLVSGVALGGTLAGGRSGDFSPLAMGKLWAEPRLFEDEPVCVYRAGKLWKANQNPTWELPVGRYRRGRIWEGDRTWDEPVGRYARGKIWLATQLSDEPPVGQYSNGTVWKGDDVWTQEKVASYEGEGDGAAACAFLLKML